MREMKKPPDEHHRFIKRCHELAAVARQAGEAAVGSVIVLDGAIVAEGAESVKTASDVTAHAEIVAIRAATGKLGTTDLAGSTLYTSVAPCPMCAYAIRLARISLVVSASPEPDAGRSIDGRMILTTPDAVPNRGVPRLLP